MVRLGLNSTCFLFLVYLAAAFHLARSVAEPPVERVLEAPPALPGQALEATSLGARIKISGETAA